MGSKFCKILQPPSSKLDVLYDFSLWELEAKIEQLGKGCYFLRPKHLKEFFSFTDVELAQILIVFCQDLNEEEEKNLEKKKSNKSSSITNLIEKELKINSSSSSVTNNKVVNKNENKIISPDENSMEYSSLLINSIEFFSTLCLVSKKIKNSLEERLLFCLKLIDVNNDGYLTYHELFLVILLATRGIKKIKNFSLFISKNTIENYVNLLFNTKNSEKIKETAVSKVKEVDLISIDDIVRFFLANNISKTYLLIISNQLSGNISQSDDMITTSSFNLEEILGIIEQQIELKKELNLVRFQKNYLIINGENEILNEDNAKLVIRAREKADPKIEKNEKKDDEFILDFSDNDKSLNAKLKLVGRRGGKDNELLEVPNEFHNDPIKMKENIIKVKNNFSKNILSSKSDTLINSSSSVHPDLKTLTSSFAGIIEGVSFLEKNINENSISTKVKNNNEIDDLKRKRFMNIFFLKNFNRKLYDEFRINQIRSFLPPNHPVLKIYAPLGSWIHEIFSVKGFEKLRNQQRYQLKKNRLKELEIKENMINANQYKDDEIIHNINKEKEFNQELIHIFSIEFKKNVLKEWKKLVHYDELNMLASLPVITKSNQNELNDNYIQNSYYITIDAYTLIFFFHQVSCPISYSDATECLDSIPYNQLYQYNIEDILSWFRYHYVSNNSTPTRIHPFFLLEEGEMESALNHEKNIQDDDEIYHEWTAPGSLIILGSATIRSFQAYFNNEDIRKNRILNFKNNLNILFNYCNPLKIIENEIVIRNFYKEVMKKIKSINNFFTNYLSYLHYERQLRVGIIEPNLSSKNKLLRYLKLPKKKLLNLNIKNFFLNNSSNNFIKKNNVFIRNPYKIIPKIFKTSLKIKIQTIPYNNLMTKRTKGSSRIKPIIFLSQSTSNGLMSTGPLTSEEDEILELILIEYFSVVHQRDSDIKDDFLYNGQASASPPPPSSPTNIPPSPPKSSSSSSNSVPNKDSNLYKSFATQPKQDDLSNHFPLTDLLNQLNLLNIYKIEDPQYFSVQDILDFYNVREENYYNSLPKSHAVQMVQYNTAFWISLTLQPGTSLYTIILLKQAIKSFFLNLPNEIKNNLYSTVEVEYCVLINKETNKKKHKKTEEKHFEKENKEKKEKENSNCNITPDCPIILLISFLHTDDIINDLNNQLNSADIFLLKLFENLEINLEIHQSIPEILKNSMKFFNYFNNLYGLQEKDIKNYTKKNGFFKNINIPNFEKEIEKKLKKKDNKKKGGIYGWFNGKEDKSSSEDEAENEKEKEMSDISQSGNFTEQIDHDEDSDIEFNRNKKKYGNIDGNSLEFIKYLKHKKNLILFTIYLLPHFTVKQLELLCEFYGINEKIEYQEFLQHKNNQECDELNSELEVDDNSLISFDEAKTSNLARKFDEYQHNKLVNKLKKYLNNYYFLFGTNNLTKFGKSLVQDTFLLGLNSKISALENSVNQKKDYKKVTTKLSSLLKNHLNNYGEKNDEFDNSTKDKLKNSHDSINNFLLKKFINYYNLNKKKKKSIKLDEILSSTEINSSINFVLNENFFHLSITSSNSKKLDQTKSIPHDSNSISQWKASHYGESNGISLWEFNKLLDTMNSNTLYDKKAYKDILNKYDLNSDKDNNLTLNGLYNLYNNINIEEIYQKNISKERMKFIDKDNDEVSSKEEFNEILEKLNPNSSSFSSSLLEGIGGTLSFDTYRLLLGSLSNFITGQLFISGSIDMQSISVFLRNIFSGLSIFSPNPLYSWLVNWENLEEYKEERELDSLYELFFPSKGNHASENFHENSDQEPVLGTIIRQLTPNFYNLLYKVLLEPGGLVHYLDGLVRTWCNGREGILPMLREFIHLHKSSAHPIFGYSSSQNTQSSKTCYINDNIHPLTYNEDMKKSFIQKIHKDIKEVLSFILDKDEDLQNLLKDKYVSKYITPTISAQESIAKLLNLSIEEANSVLNLATNQTLSFDSNQNPPAPTPINPQSTDNLAEKVTKKERKKREIIKGLIEKSIENQSLLFLNSFKPSTIDKTNYKKLFDSYSTLVHMENIEEVVKELIFKKENYKNLNKDKNQKNSKEKDNFFFTFFNNFCVLPPSKTQEGNFSYMKLHQIFSRVDEFFSSDENSEMDKPNEEILPKLGMNNWKQLRDKIIKDLIFLYEINVLNDELVLTLEDTNRINDKKKILYNLLNDIILLEFNEIVSSIQDFLILYDLIRQFGKSIGQASNNNSNPLPAAISSSTTNTKTYQYKHELTSLLFNCGVGLGFGNKEFNFKVEVDGFQDLLSNLPLGVSRFCQEECEKNNNYNNELKGYDKHESHILEENLDTIKIENVGENALDVEKKDKIINEVNNNISNKSLLFPEKKSECLCEWHDTSPLTRFFVAKFKRFQQKKIETFLVLERDSYRKNLTPIDLNRLKINTLKKKIKQWRKEEEIILKEALDFYYECISLINVKNSKNTNLKSLVENKNNSLKKLTRGEINKIVNNFESLLLLTLKRYPEDDYYIQFYRNNFACILIKLYNIDHPLASAAHDLFKKIFESFSYLWEEPVMVNSLNIFNSLQNEEKIKFNLKNNTFDVTLDDFPGKIIECKLLELSDSESSSSKAVFKSKFYQNIKKLLQNNYNHFKESKFSSNSAILSINALENLNSFLILKDYSVKPFLYHTLEAPREIQLELIFESCGLSINFIDAKEREKENQKEKEDEETKEIEETKSLDEDTQKIIYMTQTLSSVAVLISNSYISSFNGNVITNEELDYDDIDNLNEDDDEMELLLLQNKLNSDSEEKQKLKEDDDKEPLPSDITFILLIILNYYSFLTITESFVTLRSPSILNAKKFFAKYYDLLPQSNKEKLNQGVATYLPSNNSFLTSSSNLNILCLPVKPEEIVEQLLSEVGDYKRKLQLKRQLEEEEERRLKEAEEEVKRLEEEENLKKLKEYEEILRLKEKEIEMERIKKETKLNKKLNKRINSTISNIANSNAPSRNASKLISSIKKSVIINKSNFDDKDESVKVDRDTNSIDFNDEKEIQQIIASVAEAFSPNLATSSASSSSKLLQSHNISDIPSQLMPSLSVRDSLRLHYKREIEEEQEQLIKRREKLRQKEEKYQLQRSKDRDQRAKLSAMRKNLYHLVTSGDIDKIYSAKAGTTSSIEEIQKYAADDSDDLSGNVSLKKTEKQ